MAASSLLLPLSALAADPDYVYQRAGNEADIETAVKGGVVLMGGGKDVAEAFAWMIYSPSPEKAAQKAVCLAGQPLQVTGIRVLRVKAGDPFDFATWTGTGVPATVGAKAGATMEAGSL